MMLIYLCHKFGGKKRNVRAVEKIYKTLVKLVPEHCFFSPHHATGFMYKHTTRRQGMDYCLEVLSRCDVMFTFGENSMSEGCMEEKLFCKEHDIPIIDLIPELFKS